MMSLRAVHAGTGYRYLLSSVATNDAAAGETGKGPPSLSDYYQAKGTPAGKWIGGGLAGFASESAAAGQEITETQMAALYGEGLHPDADERMLAGESLSDVKIGRAFAIYSGQRSVLGDIAEAEKTFRLAEERLPTDEERNELAEQIGRAHYTQSHPDSDPSGKNVIAWVNEQRDQVKQAVSGFDFTFSPAKSVSVLWALSDEQTAAKIAALHHRAVAETIEWAEDNAAFTRRGTNGIEQIATRGLIASEFTHFDTRSGDPDLHSHVLVSNKVQGVDGKWRALDGSTIFQLHQSISARYDTALQDLLAREMDVDFEAHARAAGTEPVWEVAGIDRSLIDGFSKRRVAARSVYDRLAAEHVARTGTAPSRRQSYALWQSAILETRDAKKPAESLADMRSAWREEAEQIVGTQAVDTLTDSVVGTAIRPVFDPSEHTDLVADQALDTVISKRARFRKSHLDTAVSTALKGYRFDSSTERSQAHSAVLDRALGDKSVSLTPMEPLALPGALTTIVSGVDRRANSELFSTAAVLTAEQSVLDAATEPVPVFASDDTIRRATERFEADRTFALNDGQKTLARHLLQTGSLVASGVGPAGTGKSASMGLVSAAWTAEGRSVIPLSTAKSAADVLGDELGQTGRTIDSLTYTWTGQNAARAARDLTELPVTIRAGDMLLVDEAGMASTDNLHALTDIAREAGAVVRLIGDPMQLDAVATGGLFRELARVPGTPMLDEVLRFNGDTAQAEASLALRHGDATGVQVHNERGWIHGGTRAAMIDQAVEAYLSDRAAGTKSLIVAGRNSDCDAINHLVRQHYIDTGVVDTDRELTIGRGEKVAAGDTVIARRNQIFFGDSGRPAGRVANGDLFTVQEVGDDGSLRVWRTSGTADREMILPADYVHEHVHLGYASTVHRAQGATVDTCHAIADTSMDRSGLYVAATRGKAENRLYAVTEFDPDIGAEDGHMHSAGDEWPSEPAAFLAALLAHDRSQRSAVEAMREEMHAATSTERVAALYAHGADLAAAQFTESTLPEYIDALPAIHSAGLDPDSQPYAAIAAAWNDAALAGVDPREHWLHITDNLETADRPGALMAWRLREQIPDTPDTPHVAPDHAGRDAELHNWLHTTRDELTEQVDPADLWPTVEMDVPWTTGDLTAAWTDATMAAPWTQAALTGIGPHDIEIDTSEEPGPADELRPASDLDGGRLTDTDLSRTDFRGRDLTDVSFMRCDLTGARFDEATLDATMFAR
ncbi:MAG: relaxase domain-containing protein, partial [Corynebacterium sp.]|uniref:MobF family relaxase n=1 Tax=Corynebacterium sp. TaxID=1720 RepID=UPI0026489595